MKKFLLIILCLFNYCFSQDIEILIENSDYEGLITFFNDKDLTKYELNEYLHLNKLIDDELHHEYFLYLRSNAFSLFNPVRLFVTIFIGTPNKYTLYGILSCSAAIFMAQQSDPNFGKPTFIAAALGLYFLINGRLKSLEYIKDLKLRLRNCELIKAYLLNLMKFKSIE